MSAIAHHCTPAKNASHRHKHQVIDRVDKQLAVVLEMTNWINARYPGSTAAIQSPSLKKGGEKPLGGLVDETICCDSVSSSSRCNHVISPS